MAVCKVEFDDLELRVFYTHTSFPGDNCCPQKLFQGRHQAQCQLAAIFPVKVPRPHNPSASGELSLVEPLAKVPWVHSEKD